MTEKRPLSIEYCTSWGYLSKAASLAETLLNDHDDKIQNLTLIPSSGGVFEITFGDSLIYSKKATGEFPEPADIVATVAAE